jgi:hypothetical protein
MSDPVKTVARTSTSLTLVEVEDGAIVDPASSSSAIVNDVILKLPALTWYYWGEKMTATTFGNDIYYYFNRII